MSTPTRSVRRAGLGLAAAGMLVALAACTSNSPAPAASGTTGGPIAVSSTADACKVTSATAPSGNIAFNVKNDGSDVTEFYLLAEDGLRIIAEVENIGPGLSRDLVTVVKPGKYLTACKPGMVGKGIRAEFTVTDSGSAITPAGTDQEQITAAEASYLAYVKDQSEQLVSGTQEFVTAYIAGDDKKARSLYAPVRVNWERIEPVAESFGDLDPAMDLREADLADGEEWTGWHLLEKDLWQPTAAANGGEKYSPLSAADRKKFAEKLLADTNTLNERVHASDFALTIDQVANGSRALLDEVAKGKVTGEEEIWSHTDLWDFQANVDGAKVAYDSVADIVAAKDPALATQTIARFASLQKLLDAQRDGEGFTLYNEISDADIKALSDDVNALSESLSHLAATILNG